MRTAAVFLAVLLLGLPVSANPAPAAAQPVSVFVFHDKDVDGSYGAQDSMNLNLAVTLGFSSTAGGSAVLTTSLNASGCNSGTAGLADGSWMLKSIQVPAPYVSTGKYVLVSAAGQTVYDYNPNAAFR